MYWLQGREKVQKVLGMRPYLRLIRGQQIIVTVINNIIIINTVVVIAITRTKAKGIICC